jgi:PDZ domain-containing secreted protein/Zn-dependent protease
MTKSSFTFLRVRGIPIGAHWTWSLVFVLLTLSLTRDVFPQMAQGLSAPVYATMAVVTSLAFFASIVLHELGHAFQALREGMKIDGITLWLFGGIARFLGTFPGPGAEFRVAIAGPAVSLAISVAMWGLAAGADAAGLSAAFEAVPRYLARINFVLVAFNLVPALPLDGGRVLRAVLWHRQGNFTAATISASRAGKAFGYVLIGMGVAGLVTQVATGSALFAFLGWFLLQAARAEASYALMLRALEGVTAADLMTPANELVAPSMTIARFFDEFTQGRSLGAYPVGTDGHLGGLVTVARAGSVAPQARELTTVADVMVRKDELATLDRTAGAVEALAALQGGAPAAVVVSGAQGYETVEGVLTIADLARGVELQQARGAQAEAPVRPAGWWIWAVVVLSIAGSIASIYHPPYVVISPGPALDLSQDVEIVGADVHPVNGRYLLVSIRQTSPNVFGLIMAGVRSDREVIPFSSVDSIPANQFEIFEQSRQMAAAAAARSQGLHVQISGTGARVVQTLRDAPADGVLRADDVIVAIDGEPVTQDADVRRVIRSRRTGTRFDLTVERGDRRVTLPVRSAELDAAGQGAAAIGVFLETRDFRLDLPFQIRFRERPGIAGPSAGLAYALVIAEMLGPEDLGRDRTIAATGTIDVQGTVGEIGGVAEKARAAKGEDATVFIVPSREVDDVGLASLTVRGAQTLDEALAILRKAS